MDLDLVVLTIKKNSSFSVVKITELKKLLIRLPISALDSKEQLVYLGH